jgi:hypothetical protein
MTAPAHPRPQVGRGPGTLVLAVGLAVAAAATHATAAPSGARTVVTAACLLTVPGLGLLAWLPPLTADLRAAVVLTGSVATVALVSMALIGADAYRPAPAAAVATATGLGLLGARVLTRPRRERQRPW